MNTSPPSTGKKITYLELENQSLKNKSKEFIEQPEDNMNFSQKV